MNVRASERETEVREKRAIWVKPWEAKRRGICDPMRGPTPMMKSGPGVGDDMVFLGCRKGGVRVGNWRSGMGRGEIRR